MDFMMAFGLASIMLCLGVFLRARISFLRNMLVPSCVIAGVIGFIFMNALSMAGVSIGTDADMYTEIVNHLFTVSFISISLTATPKGADNNAKNTMKGAVGMGLVWCFLYALTPIVATGVLMLVGGAFDMNAIYGMLIQFAFCQGPGQAASYGTLVESYGWEHAAMVAIAFAAIGFVAAFAVGVPAAKRGIKCGIAKHCGKLDDIQLRGFMHKAEQTEVMPRDTTCSSNIETLTFHFAVIGLCYILAVGIAKLFAMLPGFLGTSMSGMMFMNGMIAAYIVKFAMKKLKIDYLLENTLQSKLTGWTSDYLVVCAFMAVSVSIISEWMAPILAVSAVTTVVTYVVCFYFGKRLGGSNDFERTLGLYGTATGTIPSGISLVRIVDPHFHTSTSVELGASNIVMMASTPVVFIILAMASGALSLAYTMLALAICAIVYLAALKLTKTWGNKTYDFKK